MACCEWTNRCMEHSQLELWWQSVCYICLPTAGYAVVIKRAIVCVFQSAGRD